MSRYTKLINISLITNYHHKSSNVRIGFAFIIMLYFYSRNFISQCPTSDLWDGNSEFVATVSNSLFFHYVTTTFITSCRLAAKSVGILNSLNWLHIGIVLSPRWMGLSWKNEERYVICHWNGRLVLLYKFWKNTFRLAAFWHQLIVD